MVIVPLLAVALYFSGCVGEIGDIPEAQTPTGCHKSEGRYYDPQVGKCVHPSSPHEARVLNEYRYVNKLAEEGKVEEAEFYISFKWTTIEKTEEIWSFIHQRGANMHYVSALLPEDRVYETNWGEAIIPEGPKMWKGSHAVSCGWGSRTSGWPEVQTIQNFVEMSIKEDEEKTGQEMILRRKAIFEDGDCRIRNMSVTASPAVMRDVWNTYLDDIEAIQPQITTVDKAQGALGPSYNLVEGK